MGNVFQGIPEEIVIELANLNGSTTFVETGTFQGGTARWAAGHFETVHTIERSEQLYNLHSKELATIKGVTPHLGDSRDILPQIVANSGLENAVYWLDGHWSGGVTAGEHDECPLLDELACLHGRTKNIILIDDARLFLCAPPLPHDPSQWPTIVDIVSALSAFIKRPVVQIVDDVIFIIPDVDALRNRLVSYAQTRSEMFWEEFSKTQRKKSFFNKCLRPFLSRTRAD